MGEIGIGVAALGGFLLGLILIRRSLPGGGRFPFGRMHPGRRHSRGRQIAGASLAGCLPAFGHRLSGTSAPTRTLRVGGIRIPPALEPYHLLCAGSPGSGKSVALADCLETLRRRGDRVLVADCGGDFLSRFHQRGDRILNPVDERSVDWAPLAEMSAAWDAERLARSLVPTRGGAEAEWHHYAQSLVAAVLGRLWETGRTATGTLVDILARSPNGELSAHVAGHPAQTLFEEGAERMLGSVRAIVGTYLAPYRFLDPTTDANGFSVRRWATGGEGGWLFLPYRDDQLAVMRPLLAAWIDLAVGALLSQPPDSRRRFWLVLDELGALGTIPVLTDALTRGRKYGLACLAGVQSVSQLDEAYGSASARILRSCFGSLLVLRTQEAGTAEALSRELGEREIVMREWSHGRGGASHTDRRQFERLILPGEIQALPDCRGYLALAGNHPIRPVRLKPRARPEVTEPFRARTPSGATGLPLVDTGVPW